MILRMGLDLSNYMNIVKKHILTRKKNKNLFDSTDDANIQEILKIIKDYLMNQIYNHIFPKNTIVNGNDIIFYEKTQKLSWVTPEHLNIKKMYINQLTNADEWIKKMDDEKSIKDKLICVQNAFNTMNNTIKFSLGKEKDAGQDELIPIFHYILIKAQPQKMYSNINYLECFLEESELNSNYGKILEQMKSAAKFIININHSHLNLADEGFHNNNNNKKN